MCVKSNLKNQSDSTGCSKSISHEKLSAAVGDLKNLIDNYNEKSASFKIWINVFYNPDGYYLKSGSWYINYNVNTAPPPSPISDFFFSLS